MAGPQIRARPLDVAIKSRNDFWRHIEKIVSNKFERTIMPIWALMTRKANAVRKKCQFNLVMI